MATTSDVKFRDGRRAVELAEKGVRLKDDAPYRGTLAAAYAEAGRFDDAVTEQERAIEMLRTAGRDDEVADYQTRLDLHRSGQPYRERTRPAWFCDGRRAP